MIQPTIRCAKRGCNCSVPMDAAMRVGTRFYCSFQCANGYGEVSHIRSLQVPGGSSALARKKTG